VSLRIFSSKTTMVACRRLTTIACWTGAIVALRSSITFAYVSLEPSLPIPEPIHRDIHRRRFLGSAAVAFVSFVGDKPVTNSVAFADDSVNESGIIRSKGCYQGIGDACADFADDNALIQKLQQQSALNRARNEREALNAYYMKNYPDFFGSIGKVMIKKASDNTFIIVSLQEAEQMKLDGRLALEIPKARGGKIVDLTQKPILILKE
jgi:hypothetical protein